ncbi:MAG: hypothetical protein ACTHOU_12010 [Aureliella sp.]
MESLKIWILVGVALLAGGQSRLSAYTPDDPEVVAMVDRAVAFLERNADGSISSVRIHEGEIGTHSLVGYTIFKATGDPDHPLVKRGIAASIDRIQVAATRPQASEKIIYEASLAALFLADVDAVKYRPELIKARDFLQNHQKRHGGYGYLQSASGDTSQTQYAAFGLWALHKNGIEVSTQGVESMLRYLIITQDPTGGWGYQAILPPGQQLVPQEGVAKSLGGAGLCATLLAADTLGILGRRAVVEDDPDVPKAFTRIDLVQKEKETRSASTMKLEDVSNTINKGIAYQRANPSMSAGRSWYHYFRYTEERYESFLEVLSGKKDKSPAWYNTGVEEMRRLQDRNGAFGITPPEHTGPDVCTSFAILYLIRSTQKTIAKLNEGVMAGGYGLPSDPSKVRRVGNQLVGEETASVEGLLEMMEKNKTDNVEVGLLPEDLALSRDPAERKSQVARLARLLSSKDWKSRRIAAKLLGRSEDVNQIPELIYALTDPDSEVPVIAEESLRLLSRKLTVRHLDSDASPEKKEEAARYWRQWYSSLRPDYVFLDK